MSPGQEDKGSHQTRLGVDLPCLTSQEEQGTIGWFNSHPTNIYCLLWCVWGLVLSTEDTEVTKGKIDLEICKVESLLQVL